MSKLADLVRAAASKGRRLAAAYPASTKKDELPWKVIGSFDADVRGHVERDRRIEDERNRVLIAAVNLSETPLDADARELESARRHLVDAIDYLEQAVLRFGIVNREAARQGYGDPGDRVSSER